MDTCKALAMGQARVCAFCRFIVLVVECIRHFYKMGVFNPRFADKESESHKGLTVCPGSHREPVAKPGSKPRQFASNIYVLYRYVMPACPLKLGIGTGLTPHFTAPLTTPCKDKSVILVRDSFVHRDKPWVTDPQEPGTGWDSEDTDSKDSTLTAPSHWAL